MGAPVYVYGSVVVVAVVVVVVVVVVVCIGYLATARIHGGLLRFTPSSAT